MTVLIGSLSLSKGTQRVGILSYEYPKTFNAKTKQDDIMLIKVRMNWMWLLFRHGERMILLTVCFCVLPFVLQLNKKVKAKPQKIPKKEKDVPTGTNCVVTGWGTTDSNVMEPSDKLQMLEVSVMNRERCNRYYNGDPEITKDMLCAGGKQEKTGTCWVCHIMVFDLWLVVGSLKSSFYLSKGRRQCVVFFREIPVDLWNVRKT